MGEAQPSDEAVTANADQIIFQLRQAKLANTNVVSRIGYAFAAALIQRRADIREANTGDGIYWPIKWDVFTSIIEIAEKGGSAYGELINYIMSEMELLAWKTPTN